MRTPSRTVSFLLLLVVILAAACRPPSQTNGSSVCVVALFDVSASASAQATKDHYLQDFGKVASALQPGDLVIADTITENPSATMAFPVQVSLPVYDAWQTSPLLHRQALQTARDGLASQVTTLVREARPTQNTAILDALYVTRKALNNATCRNAAHRALIVFTDGEEDSARGNFLRDEMTPSRTERLLRKEQRESHLPDLRGVQVWIAGATPNPIVVSRTIRAIEAFWDAYFARTGAIFTLDHYGPALLNFDLSRSLPTKSDDKAGVNGRPQ